MTAQGLKQRGIAKVAVPAGIALVAAGVLVGRTTVRPTPPSAAREVTSPAPIAEDPRLSALEREVRNLRVQVAASSRAQAAEQPERAPIERAPAPEDALDPAEAELVAEEARSEFFDDAADRLEAEPRDADFRAQMEPAISRLLVKHLGPEVRVSDVACGSSMCRADVIHPGSPRLAEDRVADFMLQRGPLGKMSVQLDLREEGITTLFFVRGDG